MPLMRLILFSLATALLASSASAATSKRAERGLALARQHCAACHAVTANATSPHPQAPGWDDIANRPGTTERTLRRFLADSHNYPEAMQFRIERRHLRELSAWIVTLQREGYQPTR